MPQRPCRASGSDQPGRGRGLDSGVPAPHPRSRRPGPIPGPRLNPGRAAALDRLAEEAARYPEFGLDPLETPHASDRDAALAHAIYDTAVRRWLTISFLAGQHLRQPWDGLEPGVLGALLGGAAQLLFFDRIPPHSAIDEAVEWTKHRVNPQAAGLVNAVLRRIAGMVIRGAGEELERRAAWTGARDELPLADGRALVLAGQVLPPDVARRTAAATGVPTWQVQQWIDVYGEDDALHMAWHSIAPAPTIVYAPGGMAAHPDLAAHESANHRVFVGARAGLLELLAGHPGLWVQDPTASAAIAGLPEQDATVVVDLCAGRGTKTRQLLARFPAAEVTACEVSTPRLDDLQALARSAEGRLAVCRPDRAAQELRGRCDLVVADVPCSNSGVLARRVEARHRCGARQLARLGEQQREIVALAASLLRPGGMLLYSTCSLETPENAGVAIWAARALGLTIADERQRLPLGGPGEPAGEYQDGGYAAVLTAPGVAGG